MPWQWPWTRAAPDAPAVSERDHWSTHAEVRRGQGGKVVQALLATAARDVPAPAGATGMDANSSSESAKRNWRWSGEAISDVIASWYGSQTFIGYQMCAILAQHWLVDKACTMPARDAIRNGFERSTPNEEGLAPDVIKALRLADRRYKLQRNLVEYVRQGRIFGIRIVLYVVDGIDYEAPFNPDGVRSGSYRGMSQIDPYWCVPELDQAAVTDPAAIDYYEPEWWNIQGRRYHRSHLSIFRTGEVADILKPMYRYGGVSVPQRIMERIYAAERTANEAPQLAMTKRLLVHKMDMAGWIGRNRDEQTAAMDELSAFRDNYGRQLIDEDDELTQIDTTLTDLDSVIMTQYQIVAAIAGVPSTKLMGTQPKGFNSAGTYEESSYHEELETIQEHDLTPLIEGHDVRVMRSDIIGKIAGAQIVETSVSWRELASVTATEQADINLKKAQTGAALVTSGAIDGQDERDRIREDPDSGYTGLPDVAEIPVAEPELDENGEPIPGTEVPAAGGGSGSLNGAQIASLVGLLGAVAKGEMSRESAITVVEVGFGFSREKAEEVVGNPKAEITDPKDEIDAEPTVNEE